LVITSSKKLGPTMGQGKSHQMAKISLDFITSSKKFGPTMGQEKEPSKD